MRMCRHPRFFRLSAQLVDRIAECIVGGCDLGGLHQMLDCIVCGNTSVLLSHLMQTRDEHLDTFRVVRPLQTAHLAQRLPHHSLVEHSPRPSRAPRPLW
jgi:hypothetical protein